MRQAAGAREEACVYLRPREGGWAALQRELGSAGGVLALQPWELLRQCRTMLRNAFRDALAQPNALCLSAVRQVLAQEAARAASREEAVRDGEETLPTVLLHTDYSLQDRRRLCEDVLRREVQPLCRACAVVRGVEHESAASVLRAVEAAVVEQTSVAAGASAASSSSVAAAAAAAASASASASALTATTPTNGDSSNSSSRRSAPIVIVLEDMECIRWNILEDLIHLLNSSDGAASGLGHPAWTTTKRHKRRSYVLVLLCASVAGYPWLLEDGALHSLDIVFRRTANPLATFERIVALLVQREWSLMVDESTFSWLVEEFQTQSFCVQTFVNQLDLILLEHFRTPDGAFCAETELRFVEDDDDEEEDDTGAAEDDNKNGHGHHDKTDTRNSNGRVNVHRLHHWILMRREQCLLTGLFPCLYDLFDLAFPELRKQGHVTRQFTHPVSVHYIAGLVLGGMETDTPTRRGRRAHTGEQLLDVVEAVCDDTYFDAIRLQPFLQRVKSHWTNSFLLFEEPPCGTHGLPPPSTNADADAETETDAHAGAPQAAPMTTMRSPQKRGRKANLRVGLQSSADLLAIFAAAHNLGLQVESYLESAVMAARELRLDVDGAVMPQVTALRERAPAPASPAHTPPTTASATSAAAAAAAAASPDASAAEEDDTTLLCDALTTCWREAQRLTRELLLKLRHFCLHSPGTQDYLGHNALYFSNLLELKQLWRAELRRVVLGSLAAPSKFNLLAFTDREPDTCILYKLCEQYMQQNVRGKGINLKEVFSRFRGIVAPSSAVARLFTADGGDEGGDSAARKRGQKKKKTPSKKESNAADADQDSDAELASKSRALWCRFIHSLRELQLLGFCYHPNARSMFAVRAMYAWTAFGSGADLALQDGGNGGRGQKRAGSLKNSRSAGAAGQGRKKPRRRGRRASKH